MSNSSHANNAVENIAPESAVDLGPICVVVDPWDLPFNGTVVSSRRFVNALRNQGYGFRILSCPAEGVEPHRSSSTDNNDVDSRQGRLERCYFPVLSVPGVNRIIRGMKVLLARSKSEQMRQALTGAGILHVQFPFFLGYAAIRMARSLGVPVVCSFHVQPENLLLNLGLDFRWLRELLYKVFIHFIYNKADMVIAPSQFAADELLKRDLRKPIEVVSNGVPDEFFQAMRSAEHDSSDDTFRVLSVGRLSGEKQQALLIEAIALSEHREKISLELVGAGPNEAKLKALISQRGIKATVETVSNDELLKRYRDADLFVHCGMIELEGMSVVEAMAMGNAVLVSDSIDSAANVFALDDRAKFKAGDAKDLSLKLDYLINHSSERMMLANKNRNFIQAYRHETCVAKLLSLYVALAEQSNDGLVD